jgi:hypothetical protein
LDDLPIAADWNSTEKTESVTDVFMEECAELKAVKFLAPRSLDQNFEFSGTAKLNAVKINLHLRFSIPLRLVMLIFV